MTEEEQWISELLREFNQVSKHQLTPEQVSALQDFLVLNISLT